MAELNNSTSQIVDKYPLHWKVWHNHYRELDALIKEGKNDIELLDARGRTPLMLAVILGHLESTKVLLRHNANVDVENKDGWTAVNEAVATGDPEILQAVLELRDSQRQNNRNNGIADLLRRLNDAPDFYVEMKWEFTSWVPLVSRMCPSDTYKIYKRGANVRVDTTLLGFGQNSWQRGSRTYIFKGDQTKAIFMEIDHDTKQVYTEQLYSETSTLTGDDLFSSVSDDAISSRLTSPIVITYVDTDKIFFDRCKSGIWGWRSERTDQINSYDCKVYSACNVELVTKTRTEHLTEADKQRIKGEKSALQSLLGIADIEEVSKLPIENGEVAVSKGNMCNMSAEEYFNPPEPELKRVASGEPSASNGNGTKSPKVIRDIGRPKEITSRTQKFKAHLWLADTYPLSLPEQILPIVDLMAISSSHFAKLRDFITLQLPAGFPVKIEIPLFHVLKACVTFGNIFATDTDCAMEGVSTTVSPEDETKLICKVDERVFDAPATYIRLGGEHRQQYSMDENDQLMQFAIQQSLLDAGSEQDQVTVWEALKHQRPISPSATEEERLLQKAIEESLSMTSSQSLPLNLGALAAPDQSESTTHSNPSPSPSHNSALGSRFLEEEQLRLALEMSNKEQELMEKQRLEEESALEEILKLSLVEK